MKRILIGITCLAIIIIGYVGLVWAQTEETSSEGKVIYQFKDADEMAEFEQLFLTKQAISTRMAVLQSYLAMESANLQQIDNQINQKFDFVLEPQRAYELQRDTMVIRDVGELPQQ